MYLYCPSMGLPTPQDWTDQVNDGALVSLWDLMSDWEDEHYKFFAATTVAHYWDGEQDADYEPDADLQFSCLDCGSQAVLLRDFNEWSSHIGGLLVELGWLRCPETMCNALIFIPETYEDHRENAHGGIFPADPGDTIPVFDATWKPTRIEPPTTHENW